MHNTLTKLNSPITAILTLIAAIWLADYSLHYKPSVIDANSFVADKLASYEADKQRHLLNELYGAAYE